MTMVAIANKSIKWLYLGSALLMVAVIVRLMFPFPPKIEIRPATKAPILAPFLPVPNIGPIARETWLKSTLRECFSFPTSEMQNRISSCSTNYFDIRGQNSFETAIPNTSFGQFMASHPNTAAEVQAINTNGPFMIFDGYRSGRPVWRYQTEIMTTLFFAGRTATKRWLVDATMTFDTPDALYFSGFRFLSFFMKERT